MKYIISILLVITLAFGSFLFFSNQSEKVNEPENITENTQEDVTENSTIEYGDITPDQARQLIEEDPSIILLDVRTKEEYEERHIPDSTLIPLQELTSRLDELDKGKTYLIYCRSGNRSSQAFKFLKDQGFKKLYNLMGGITAYYN